ncbi:outer membrane protein assembly factor BamB family protein [Calycomorphotria hydatis]|uniref:Outer membrane biogenesis protein BamB n=1 Tax=Calycomorphotria hydatis TaxID=2528027 RepID=A0A517TCX6_9PLAN|nr:PQQ-binding-like beta-propeller repeat protein [Calycomorphotria hydatis]QDT66230.1 outer membrane biogenesis protein BamB [Calycomorphotria hydatis]
MRRLSVLCLSALIMWGALPTAEAQNANPLQQFFQNLFRGPVAEEDAGENPDAEVEAPENENRYERTTTDPVDALVPHDGAMAKLLRRAWRLVDEEQWDDARELLTYILEKSENSVVRLRNGKIQSVALEANRLLNRLPEEVQEDFRTQYGGLAESLLEQARDEARPDLAILVADRFLQTEAGQKAANFAGTCHLDRGEAGLAMLYFDRLMEVESPITKTDHFQLKVAQALLVMGKTKEARQVLNGITGEFSEHHGKLLAQVESGELVATNYADRHVEQWRNVSGNATRNGQAEAVEPLLLKRWNYPLSFSGSLNSRLEQLTADLIDQKHAPIPTFEPVTLGNLIAFRTLRGVSVLDARSGALVWETDATNSVESILEDPQASGHSRSVEQFKVLQRNILANMNSASADRNPLACLLYRDATYGSLSTDGTRLFVLEDHAALSHQGRIGRWNQNAGSKSDALGRDWSSNVLSAYQGQTGQVLWRVGGPKVESAFAGPLTGCYFMGPPLSKGDSLYVIGEKNNEIRLYGLDARTGGVLWSVLLAYSDQNISVDYVRRWWSTPVAAGAGVLICPTTVGWLVAVDTTGHRVLWTQRCVPESEGNSFSRRQRVTDMPDFNDRWVPAPPLIAGNRVVYSPSEESQLFCFDLYTGRKLWDINKGNLVAVCGQTDETVLLLGRDQVTAVKLSDGQTAWRTSIPEKHQPPVGLGLIAGNRLLVPLHGETLWSVNVDSGKVANKFLMLDSDTPLGRLFVQGGRLYSLSAAGLTAFEQRNLLVDEIAQRRKQDDHDLLAAFREAQLFHLDADLESALGILRRIDVSQLPRDVQDDYQQLLVSTLSQYISEAPAERVDLIDELRSLIQSSDGRLLADQLQLTAYIEAGQYRKAMTLGMSLLKAPDPARMVTVEHAQQVRLDLWVAGQIHDLWPLLDSAEQRDFSTEVLRYLQTAESEPIEEQVRRATLCSFHPESDRRLFEICKELITQNSPERAEPLLMRLAVDENPNTAARAEEELAQLERLARFTASASSVSQYDWGEFDVRVTRSGFGQPTNSISVMVENATGDYFGQHPMSVNTASGRLIIYESDGDTVKHVLPLRLSQQASNQRVSAVAVKHLLYLLYRDYVHCINPLTGERLWARQPHRKYQGTSRRNLGQLQYPSLQTPRSFESTRHLTRQAQTSGIMPIVNERYVCLQTHRRLEVIDALTGELMWSRDDLQPQNVVLGTTDVIYLFESNGSAVRTLRAVDGKELDGKLGESVGASGLAVTGPFVTLVDSGLQRGIFKGQGTSTRIVTFDSRNEEPVWTIPVAVTDQVGRIDDARVAVLHEGKEFKLIDLRQRVVNDFEDIPESMHEGRTRNLQALIMGDTLYFIVNKSGQGVAYFTADLPMVSVEGSIASLDITTGKLNWVSEASGFLPMVELERSPLLPFVNRQWKQKHGVNYWTTELEILDRKTGEQIIKTDVPNSSPLNPRTLIVDHKNQFVEIKSYNGNLRFERVTKGTD